MNRFSLGSLMLLWSLVCSAQTLSDFEQVLMESDAFVNGSDGSEGWEVGNIFLTNAYDTDFDFWSGWAISNKTDVTTAGFTNQYSCIAGTGVDGSSAYAVAFANENCLLSTRNEGESGIVSGFYINNSTYTYLSMQDGDAFAKKFGGENGTDPDYLYVTIKEKGNRDKGDSLNVFLADFTSDDSSEDYILDEWTYVDLSGFDNVDTLTFEMHSSDVGAFGINTPTYFCMDNLETADMINTSTEELVSSKTKESFFYPNPTQSNIQFQEPVTEMIIYDTYGQVAIQEKGTLTQVELDGLDSGSYMILIQGVDGKIDVARLTKI